MMAHSCIMYTPCLVCSPSPLGLFPAPPPCHCPTGSGAAQPCHTDAPSWPFPLHLDEGVEEGLTGPLSPNIHPRRAQSPDRGHGLRGLGSERGGTAGNELVPVSPLVALGSADRSLQLCSKDRACAAPGPGMRARDPREVGHSAGHGGEGQRTLSPPSLQPSPAISLSLSPSIPPRQKPPAAGPPLLRPGPPRPGLTWLRGTCGKRLRVVGLFGR